MMPSDENLSSTDTFDVVVVGSGAAGSIAAHTLTKCGLKVLVLEAGPLLDPDSAFPAPADNASPGSMPERLRGLLTGQPVQVHTGKYGLYLRHLFVDDRSNPYTTPFNRPYYWVRGRQVGGRLHTWGRMSIRFSDREFKAASADGYGVDWPISYDDLAPYYDTVEELLGVDGCVDQLAHLPDSRYRRAYRLTDYEIRFQKLVKRAWTGRKVVSARIMQQRTEPMPLALEEALSSGHLTLRPNSVVRRVTTDRDDMADGVEFVDRIDQTVHRVRGGAVMLCASAFETVRLLLNSSSERFPEGIGASSGLLGRYVMEHMFCIDHGDFSPTVETVYGGDPDPYDFARAIGFYIPHTPDQSLDFIRGYGIMGGIGRDGDWWWMSAFGEMLAQYENRLVLNKKKCDAWGVPAAHIDISRGDNDVALIEHARVAIDEMSKIAGFGRQRGWRSWSMADFFGRRSPWTRGPCAPGMSIHEMGGARMGTDPNQSVVDARGRCWDVPNVIVADAACFPSGGYQNPALTIMAVAARAADLASS
jgi:choline dehydrogenase-like flavoprotein